MIMKPTNPPTQGQRYPRKIRLSAAFGPLFPTARVFSLVGIDFIQETYYKKPNSTKSSANTLVGARTIQPRRIMVPQPWCLQSSAARCQRFRSCTNPVYWYCETRPCRTRIAAPDRLYKKNTPSFARDRSTQIART